MESLERYFTLFDESRISKKARLELINIFSENMSFVLNGREKNGIEQWENFLDLIFTNNIDIKHMHEGWKFIQETKRYETRWAVCGKRKDGTVYTQLGKDIAELDEDGKIKYLENVPDNSGIFNVYK
ncbi:hypothetical protein CLPUN_16480 [Clostridium puniceum]|uniref:SnoaL-like domain protein n=1 Tax=Clostridium puniceum TaxID=29367 RepID=A0A1S8TNF1_9CLOT|nr:polyketide cyclase [Clostridium puniceum]OOM79278.1 hypothetical protein CLPUN_16480 [Clostridium puniceum]